MFSSSIWRFYHHRTRRHTYLTMLHGLFLIHNSLHSFTEHGCNFILKILDLAQLKSVDVCQKDFKLEELLRSKISISPTIGFKDMYKNVSYDPGKSLRPAKIGRSHLRYWTDRSSQVCNVIHCISASVISSSIGKQPNKYCIIIRFLQSIRIVTFACNINLR